MKTVVQSLQAESTLRLAQLMTLRRAIDALLRYDAVSQPGAFEYHLGELRLLARDDFASLRELGTV